MTIPFAGRAAPAVDADKALEAEELRAYLAPLARAVLAHAVVLGIAADALLEGPSGLGFPLWITLLVLAATSLVWKAGRRMPGEARAWLAAAVLFSIGLAWRDSEMLRFLDLLAVLAALGMAAIALGNPRAALLAARLRDTLWAAAALARTVAAGLVPLVLREVALSEAPRELSGRFRPVARALAIAVALLLVFGSLLRDADPIFASIVTLPMLDVPRLIQHGMVIGFFAWLVAGWARGALMVDHGARRAPEVLPFSLGPLDVTIALGALDALFALYVATQLGWFFGGERFLQARTGLTAAAYARQGFFQMVWVVLLVVPVLVGTRALLRPGRDLERRHSALSFPLLALLGVMILSAVLRMRLYVQYYGLTMDRLYPLVFMGWLALVLGWLALTVLRGRGRLFVAGAVLTGLAVLVGLNVAAPDAIVARVNVARATHAQQGATPALDVAYLSRLGGEAAALATAATLAPPAAPAGSAPRVADDDQRCQAATRLMARWGPSSWRERARDADLAAWRSWNAGEAQATRVVKAHAAELRAVQRATCRVRRDRSPR